MLKRNANRLSVSCLVSAFSAVGVVAQADLPTQLVTHLDSLDWTEPSFTPRFPEGLQTFRISVDPETGAPTYYARFPPGTHYDLHWHTADEYVVVVEGEVTMVLGDETYELGVGAHITIPGSMPHSWDVPESGPVVILVRRAGAPDFHFVDPGCG